MQQSRKTQLGKLCDTCGAVGFKELIATCFLCTIRRHIYCMRAVEMYVHEDWVCEACLLKNAGRIENSNRMVDKAAKCTKSQVIDALPTVCTVKTESRDGMDSSPRNIWPEPEKSFQIYPDSDPAWCGCIEVIDSVSRSEFFDGLLAHLPDKVHRKALEFSKQMPGVLLCTLLPASDVLMDIFGDEPPNTEDVALYFFPGSLERSKQQFIRLFDHMETNDLILKSCINGVELLIFSSTKLQAELCGPKPIFLWGVYRRLRSNKTFALHPCNDLKSKDCAENFDAKNYEKKCLLKVKADEQFDGHDYSPALSRKASGDAAVR